MTLEFSEGKGSLLQLRNALIEQMESPQPDALQLEKGFAVKIFERPERGVEDPEKLMSGLKEEHAKASGSMGFKARVALYHALANDFPDLADQIVSDENFSKRMFGDGSHNRAEDADYNSALNLVAIIDDALRLVEKKSADPASGAAPTAFDAVPMHQHSPDPERMQAQDMPQSSEEAGDDDAEEYVVADSENGWDRLVVEAEPPRHDEHSAADPDDLLENQLPRAVESTYEAPDKRAIDHQDKSGGDDMPNGDEQVGDVPSEDVNEPREPVARPWYQPMELADRLLHPAYQQELAPLNMEQEAQSLRDLEDIGNGDLSSQSRLPDVPDHEIHVAQDQPYDFEHFRSELADINEERKTHLARLGGNAKSAVLALRKYNGGRAEQVHWQLDGMYKGLTWGTLLKRARSHDGIKSLGEETRKHIKQAISREFEQFPGHLVDNDRSRALTTALACFAAHKYMEVVDDPVKLAR